MVAASAAGAWITDVNGKRYLDFLSAYSALNFGHRHPALIAAAHKALDTLTLTSRAMRNDQLGPFLSDLCAATGMEMALPMNTGAEAVETAVKTARKWGYEVKGVRPGQAKVVVCSNNFHGRTTTIVSFSTDASARSGFGPFTPGFLVVEYGDADALAECLSSDPDVVAFLVEPVQGEAGVIVPPAGYLTRVRELCSAHDVLMIADEIQSGFGRTGSDVRLRARGRHARHVLSRQGAWRRHRGPVGGRLPPRHTRRADARNARLHLRRQPPGLRHRPRSPRSAAHGRVPGALARPSASTCSRACERRRRRRCCDVRGIGLWAGVELTADAGPAAPIASGCSNAASS